MASDVLHARAIAMARGARTTPPMMFTRDLFSLFRSNCGSCHVDQGLGGLKVELATFPAKIGNNALERIHSDDPAKYMPPKSSPAGKPFSERPDGDPVREFATLLEAWIAAGSPADAFSVDSTGSGSTGASSYLLTEEIGMQMTNVGNCIPPRQMIGREQSKMEALDELFSKATELPERLEQTDIFTLDSKVLAEHGVVAFAPAYTLWADNAKKIRMVRVPRGESIQFDAEQQRFRIPKDTRFYKTFLKKVTDVRGNVGYRKMETRLIVARPDVTRADGSAESTALFGTYAWNEAETEAVLVRDPLRNGKPFRDRLVTYLTDEKGAEAVIRSGPDDLQADLLAAGVARTYAIPGSERCIQCHMGAPDESFILGFTPLQIHRRPKGEGGVIEDAARDELNQLQRLIDYGVITGMSSPDEVVLLEDSQGDRKPRNEHELNAQGYMVGNCAHCHNPRGFPTVTAPELRDMLDFLPSAEGGIFQFPLDRFSPRIFRGVGQTTRIPYITPSLVDLDGESSAWTSKIASLDSNVDAIAFAPWRSLIYRNVDTGFTYTEDYAIFPRMPMNTPGYDCRVRRLLGSWMVSIPARFAADTNTDAAPITPEIDDELADLSEQPYVEVKEGEPYYSRHAGLAHLRLEKFRDNFRYAGCPDEAPDTVSPTGFPTVGGEVHDAEGKKIGRFVPKVPATPHWAVTDITETPGEWSPRRPDWEDPLRKGIVASKNDPTEKIAVDLLQDVALTDELKSFALTEVPFGLWQVKHGCAFNAQKKVSDIPEGERPGWMMAAQGLKEDVPVYEIAPGAQVFTMVCSQCHGAQADSRSRNANTILDMTGGETRVANLRDGFFGPTNDPGANRQRVFSAIEGSDLDADTWAARYLVWMGLGGTQRVIPQAVLTVVGNTAILGEKRQGANSVGTVGSANMLTVPWRLCQTVLPLNSSTPFRLERGHLEFDGGGVITINGDAEMWERLCAVDNPYPVRVVRINFKGTGDKLSVDSPLATAKDLYRREGYPATAPVGDQRAEINMGIQQGNDSPWCIEMPVAEGLPVFEAKWDTMFPDRDPPYCPTELFAADSMGVQIHKLTDDDENKWTIRGAMNAGLSVFHYLKALAEGDAHRVIAHDRCEQLTQ